MTDDSLIDFLCGGEFDPEFEFKMKKMEIEEKDFRVRKDSFQDINSEFRNFSQFQNTQEYQNAIRAKALLSDQWGTNSEALRETLMRYLQNEH